MRENVGLAALMGALIACAGCGRAVYVKAAPVLEEGPAVAVTQPADKEVLALDSFDGKMDLKWEILNPDPAHHSLTKKPGALTLTSQVGGFGHADTDYKNVFLVDCPTAPAGKELQVTARVVGFKPTGDWSQAGLLFWNDEDNCLKWDLEWSGRRTLMAIGETKSEWTFQQGYTAPEDTGDLWLRVIKHADRYTFQASADGKSFTTCGDKTWGDGNVKKVGIYAKNGPGSQASEVDASFELFEVKAVPMAPPAEAEHKFAIPEENLKIPEEFIRCAANIRKIQAALEKFKKDKGRWPDWLSDLVPDYLTTATLFCPDYPNYRTPYFAEKKTPCGYTYEFSAFPWGTDGRVVRDWKLEETKQFGDVVPVLRCHAHMESTNRVLNVAVNGKTYWSTLQWVQVFRPASPLGR